MKIVMLNENWHNKYEVMLFGVNRYNYTYKNTPKDTDTDTDTNKYRCLVCEKKYIS